MNIPTLPNSIQKFILNKEWAHFFDPARVARGQKIFDAGKVDFLECNGIQDSLFYFELDVLGSYDYDVTISLNQSLQFISDCNCPDGPRCKHIAAAFFEIRKTIMGQLPAAASAEHKAQNVNSWIKSLSNTLTEETEKPITDEEYFTPTYKDRVLYLISSRHNGNIQITARKGRLLKDGRYSLSHTDIKRNLYDYNKPKYITPADLEILQFIESVSNDYYYGYSVLTTSPFFKKIILDAVRTNRLIIDTLSQGQKGHYSPYSLGEERNLVPSWKPTQSGALKPSMEISPPITGLINASPNFYYDDETREVGLLNQSYSNAFLNNWADGPEISEEDVPKVTTLLKNFELSSTSKTAKPINSTPDTATEDPPAAKPSAALPLPPKQKILQNIKPQPVLTISRQDITAHDRLLPDVELQNVLIGQVTYDYDGVLVAATETAESYSTEKDGILYVVERNLIAEAAWIEQLFDQKLYEAVSIFKQEVHTQFNSSYVFAAENSINTIQWLHFLTTKQSHFEQNGWTVKTIGDLGYTIQDYDELYEDLQDRDNDWLKFDLGITVEGKRISLIPAIAAAIASGMYQGYDFPTDPDARIPIPLDEDNHFINFPAQRFRDILEKIADLFGHINDDGEIELPKLRAATLVDELDLARTDETLNDLAKLGRKLKEIKGLPKTRVPRNLAAQLRDYQIEGFRWLQFLAAHQLNGVLADDMGLGKTVQTLAHILAEKNSKRNNKLPTLVVAPTSVIPNWRAEAARFTPSLKVLQLHGTDRSEQFKQIAKHDIVITSYSLLQRDEKTHTKQQYHLVILDESQYIKNAATKTTKVAYKLKAKHRVCLSGTPMENHLGELWSTFNFLMPGLLQSNKSFNSTFRHPIERHGDAAAQISLHRRVGPLILRRTKGVVAKELPPKTVIPHYITLNDAQVDLYETVRASMDKRVRDAVKKQGFSRSHILILEALLKLRQICCHPQLLKLDAAQEITSSAKLDYLSQLLETLIEEERRILIFSQFTSMLAHIEDHLTAHGTPFVKITGSTKDRQTPVEQFQSGKVPIFLISLKAGGTGLNLTAADTVIHYDPWWNPAAENQATDRAYRIGQDKPVFVHKLICQGTIEEHIQRLQQKKSKLVESLLSESNNKLTLDQETLSGLLAPIAEQSDEDYLNAAAR